MIAFQPVDSLKQLLTTLFFVYHKGILTQKCQGRGEKNVVVFEG